MPGGVRYRRPERGTPKENERVKKALDSVDEATERLHEAARAAFGGQGDIPDSIDHIKGVLYVHEDFRKAWGGLIILRENLEKLTKV